MAKKAKLPTWRVSIITGTPAKLVAFISAKDDREAIREAIREFGIKEEQQKRLVAVRAGDRKRRLRRL
jgi:hypothetical protein